MYIRKSQRLKPYKKYDLQYYTLAWSSFELFLDAKIQIQIVMQKRRPFMRHFQSIFKHCVVESANDSIAKYHYALGKVKI